MTGERSILRTHILKTDPEYYDAVVDGRKTSEFRLNDRGFQVGDCLMLLRNVANGIASEEPVQYILVRITHMVEGPLYGIPEGYVMLSIARSSACE